MPRGAFQLPPLPRTTWNGPQRKPRTQNTDVYGRDEWPQVEFLAQLSQEAPRVPWEIFLDDVFVWRNGEHVGVIGPTGQGKTTLFMHLLPLHRFVVAFATKPRDDTMEALVDTGYVVHERWRSISAVDYPRRVLWPNATKLDSVDYQREVFDDAFRRIYVEGGWTVAIDELWYVDEILRLERRIMQYLAQARSMRISLLLATQRPAFIPLAVYDQSTHLLFFRDNDEVNLKRLSGIGWRSANLVRRVIANLEPFQFLYVNTRTGQMCRSHCPPPYISKGGTT